jgi:prevent-host-death family protein
MSRRYSVAEARAQLPSILDEVELGADIELTRRGKSVAIVISVQAYDRLRGERGDFRAAYKHFLKNHRLSEVGLNKAFADEVRDRSRGRKVAL